MGRPEQSSPARLAAGGRATKLDAQCTARCLVVVAVDGESASGTGADRDHLAAVRNAALDRPGTDEASAVDGVPLAT